MPLPTAESGTQMFGQLLSRRRALAHTGAGLAALGGVVTSTPARVVLAQEASPPADEPPTAEVTGGVTPPPPPPPVDPPPAEVTGGVPPPRAALAVERLPALAQTILQQTGVPGMSVAVVHDDALIFVDGFGVREIGKDAPIDAETVFQLASVSKSVAATVVSSVVGSGEVTWQNGIARR